MATSTANLITTNARGRAVIAGTRIKVALIALEATRLACSPADIQEAHEHLSLPQIHAALAYYEEHKAEIEAEIAESERIADARIGETNPVTRAELEARLAGRKA